MNCPFTLVTKHGYTTGSCLEGFRIAEVAEWTIYSTKTECTAGVNHLTLGIVPLVVNCAFTVVFFYQATDDRGT